MLRRCKIEHFQGERFYRLPKFLLEGSYKNTISSDAKILYCLLRDRYELSIESGWVNEEGEIYIIFTRENMAEMLGVSEKTARKAFYELQKAGLVEEERQGQGKPNLIYIMTATTVDIHKTGKSYRSREVKVAGLDRQNIPGNDTDIIDTNINVVVTETEKYVKKEEQNAVKEIQEYVKEKIGIEIPKKTLLLLLAKYGKEKVKEKILYMSRKKIHENAVGYLVIALRDNYQNMPPPAKKHKKMVVETWGKAETIPKKYDKEEVRKRKLIQGLYLS